MASDARQEAVAPGGEGVKRKGFLRVRVLGSWKEGACTGTGTIASSVCVLLDLLLTKQIWDLSALLSRVRRN